MDKGHSDAVPFFLLGSDADPAARLIGHFALPHMRCEPLEYKPLLLRQFTMPAIPPRKALMNPELRRRGIYLLPNLLTTAALFAGFYAIVQAMTGRFEYAAVAIFIAMVFDGLDGRVARMTRTQSAFGAEYDSLSDMVSFGAAPALIVFEWAMKGMGKWGWIAAFVYCAGAALRLARFNTNIGVVDKRYFQGLPSPAAAALVAGFVWIINDLNIPGEEVRWYAFALTLFCGNHHGQYHCATGAARTSTCAAACPSWCCPSSSSAMCWSRRIHRESCSPCFSAMPCPAM
jgi:CDP-diacylglycerol--serine O-phosphatidyltransferase